MNDDLFPGLDPDAQREAQRRCPARPIDPARVLVIIALIVIIFAVGLHGVHAWYVDTHCTEVLGTQVCQ
jgi:hypothetical protein